MLPTKAVAARYRVHRLTIHRWVNNPALNFPRPRIINGRYYFDETELDAHDRACARAAAVSRGTAREETAAA
jgi:hypothetical protein